MRTTWWGWRGFLWAGLLAAAAIAAAAACGDDADVTAGGGGSTPDGGGGVDATLGGADGGTDDGATRDASGLRDVAGDVVEVFGDGGACVLPANTCEDSVHIRVRSNLRADAGADGGECAWDEEVVDCHDLGGEICAGGQCTVVLR